ncbi:hypothetical protein DITRI_Ditri14bG0020000 [Diplodiscus trichospermus]
MNRVSSLKFLHPIETTTNCCAEQVVSHLVLLRIVNPVMIFFNSPFLKVRNHNSGPYDDRWHAVASWTWDAQDETCGICRMAFDGCCSDCKLPGDDCPLIWGACNHAFHLHCILKWVNSQTSQAHCPMCRREWQFKG